MYMISRQLAIVSVALLLSFAFAFTVPFSERQPSNGVSITTTTNTIIGCRRSSRAASPDDGAVQEDLFTEEITEVITSEVKKRVVIPFVPKAIVNLATTLTVKNLSKDLSPELLSKLREVMEAESTYSEFDDVSKQDLDDLTKEISEELNAKIDMPLLSEEQEMDVLQKIVGAILSVLTTTKNEFRDIRIQSYISAGRSLLDEEGRTKIVEALNAKVDLPFTNEKDEQVLLTAAVDKCADSLQEMLPPNIIQCLRGESHAGLQDTKDHIADRLSERVSLPFLPKEKEEWLVGKLVDIVVDVMVGDTEAEFLLMDSEERLIEMVKRRKLVMKEMELNQKRYDQQKESLIAQLDRIDVKIREECQ